MTDAFYLPVDHGRFEATELTRGPWDPRMQHGGPPSALMARAMDRALGDVASWVPARTMVQLVRPVPIGVLDVVAEVVRRGRSVARTRAHLTHDGTVVAQAEATFVRHGEGALDPTPPPADTGPGPQALPPFTFPFFTADVGYHTAIELRMPPTWPSPTTRAWARLRVPLLADEDPGGWCRALAFADAAHGVAPGRDPRGTTLVNPDLELGLVRRPQGVWIGLDVTTVVSPDGVGITRSTMRDTEGVVGGTSAALVVRPR